MRIARTLLAGFAFILSLFTSQAFGAGPQKFDPLMSKEFVMLATPRACDEFLQSKCQKKNPMVEMALGMCELRAKTHRCEELAREHPDLKDLIIDCTPKKFCEQHSPPAFAEAKRCLTGLADGATEMFVFLGEKIDSAWTRARTDLKQRLAFAKACDQSPECKRNLVKTLPAYRGMTDKQLEGFASLTLMTEVTHEEFMRKITPPSGNPLKPRLNPAAAKPAALTQDQGIKLMDLWNMAAIEVETKYHQYGCYTPEAMAELRCYVAGSLIDPSAAAGAAYKLTKAERILQALMKNGKGLGRVKLIRNNLHFSPTTPQQNAAWMTIASSTQARKGVRFFDVENSVMKEMNDKLKDKNLVTSLTNAHKRILQTKTDELMKELKASYPELEMLSYSDFKSSRFAFKGRGPPDLEERLAKILNDTNRDFADLVKKENLVDATAKPENWFRAGFGNTADQATISARYSRRLEDNSMQSFASEGIQRTLTANMNKAETLRTQLLSDLKSTSLMDKTLHQDAFDIIIKNSNNLPQAQLALKNRFGLSELPISSVERMKDYVTTVDGFSPGIHIADRQLATLDNAPFGGFSADMAGMGSMNQRATAEALMSSRNLDQAITNTRAGEQAVTRQFNIQKQKFQEIVTDVVGPNRVKTVCSGDDCVAIPLQALTENEKLRILQNLSSAGYASKFRLSFVSPKIKSADWRNQLSVHGESIEKNLRKNLSAKMDPEKLKGVIFGVDMKTDTLNQGRVGLLTATHPDVRLTAAEQALIRDNFNLALQQMNAGYYP